MRLVMLEVTSDHCVNSIDRFHFSYMLNNILKQRTLCLRDSKDPLLLMCSFFHGEMPVNKHLWVFVRHFMVQCFRANKTVLVRSM